MKTEWKGKLFVGILGQAPRRLSENKTLKRVAPNCVLRNLKISEAKFKIDQNMHRFDVSTGSYWTYPVYFYLYCRVCGEISKLWTD